MTSSSHIAVRPATKEDTIGIANMLRDEGLSLPPATNPQMVIDHWERLWDNNPYYKEFDTPVFYGWVLTEGENIHGFFGYMPRVYYLNGKKITVQVSTNWGIHKPYRRFAYSLCDAMFNGFPEDLKITTTAITQTGKIFSMFQSKRYPDPDFEYAYVVPLRIEKLVKHQFAKFPWLYTLGQPVLKLLNYVLPVSFQSKLIWNTKKLQQVSIDDLPPEFEQFWEACLQQSKGLIASRSIETMKWIYADIKKENRKHIFLYRNPDDQTIEGYASLILEPVVTNPEIKRYKIGDILWLSEKSKQELLKGLIIYALSNGADVLEVHLAGFIQQKDIPAFTIKRKTASFPVFYHTTNEVLQKILSEKSNWHFTAYDGDTILG